MAELRQHEAELDSRNASMVANIAELESSRDQLQQSVAEVSERNADLLQTADKLREVLKIAGEGSESLKEVRPPTALFRRLFIVMLRVWVQVEGKLFGAVDALAEQNAKMSANIVRQRRQQLLNTFEKFDVDMDTVTNPPRPPRPA